MINLEAKRDRSSQPIKDEDGKLLRDLDSPVNNEFDVSNPS